MSAPPAAEAPAHFDERAAVDLIGAVLAEVARTRRTDAAGDEAPDAESGGDAQPDLSDDCAHLPARPATRLVTTDALIEGVHFDLARDTFAQVGAQAAVANLSDLAASGGRPRWLVWSLVLPPHLGLPAIEALTRGFATVCAAAGARVVGGNLSRAAGPLVVSVTAAGDLWGTAPVGRGGARPGDVVYLSGPVGDAALGHLEPDAAARAARHRWRAHLAESRALVAWGRVTAMLDVSDGVLRDADRLGRASGVGLALQAAAVPVSAHYRARRGEDRTVALSGGEDYVLLFTAPAGAAPPIAALPFAATAIGVCTATPGLWLDGVATAPAGYDHFGAPRGHDPRGAPDDPPR